MRGVWENVCEVSTDDGIGILSMRHDDGYGEEACIDVEIRLINTRDLLLGFSMYPN